MRAQQNLTAFLLHRVPGQVLLWDRPEVFHHRRVQVSRAVAQPVTALVSGFGPLDPPAVVPRFERRRAFGAVLVAVGASAVRVQRAAASAGLVPLLVLVDGHQALGFALFSAPPGEICVSVASR